METPQAVKHKLDSADTPDTFTSSIFDDTDSLLSSSISPVSSCDGKDFEREDQPAKKHPEPHDCTLLVSKPIDRDFYGTATSQRAPRSTRRTTDYSVFFSTPRTVKAPKAPKADTPRTSDTIDSEATEAAKIAEHAPITTETPASCQVSKRKEQASDSDVSVEPPQKKVKGKTATKRTQSKRTAETKVKHVPLPSEPRQLRKRKTDTTAPEVSQSRSTKRAKITSSSHILKLKMPPGWDGSFQSVRSEEQCAQLVAPVPASSQLTSNVSQFEQHLADSQSSLQDVSNSLPVQVKFTEAAADFTAAAKEKTTAETSSFSTQPTQPWNPPAAGSDADSEATTEDEDDFEFVPPTASSSKALHILREMTERLFANRKPGLTKPAPAGQPEVWADGRQELCETLHYFRSYQSACYATGGFARGFMFDKVAHARDYIDSDVVISRAGGGMAKDKDSGEMKSSSDQTDDTPIVQALKNCIKHYNPVVIITGIDNPHIPAQPPHQYCVLDYFKPTHIWFEKSGHSKILRYRFEKLNTQKKSWWGPVDEHDPVELGVLEPPVEKDCDCCGKSSMQIYLNGWMCLQPSCAAFWNLVNGSSFGSYRQSQEPTEASLVYDPRFLKQKTVWPNDNHDYPLGSNLPEISTYAIPGEDTSQAFWSGIVCSDCGRCNSRLNYMGWECKNPTCDFKLYPPHTLIPATTIREPFWPLTNDYTMSRDVQSSLIDVSVSFRHGYRINRYALPGIDGFITHMIANKTVVEEPGGPDSMFEELQQTDIDLRRRAMPNGQLKGDSFCRQFAVNYGMPYKFIAATASHSFDTAARPITATRSRLNWAAKFLQTQETGTSMEQVSKDWIDEEFNEVLALGYFEAQKINYHDDGEFGLGPTIATLSLGAPGTMRIRMKARHYHGCSSAGVYDASPPLPGCQQFSARSALHPSLAHLHASDAKAFRARLKEIPKDLKLKASGNAKDVLRMELGHGDIVVMHGSEVQKYYEHAVEHAGKLRFALTCRYIDPKSLKEADRPGYEVGRDGGGYDGSRLC